MTPPHQDEALVKCITITIFTISLSIMVQLFTSLTVSVGYVSMAVSIYTLGRITVSSGLILVMVPICTVQYFVSIYTVTPFYLHNSTHLTYSFK